MLKVHHHKQVAVAGAAILGLLLAACSSGGGGGGNAGGSSSSGPIKVREGAIGGDISFEMQYVADNQGFFDKLGLDTSEVTTSSGVSATQALLAGDLDVVNAGGSEILKALSKGAKFKIVAPDTETFPYLLVTQKDIKSASDLKGKALGISTVGSSSYYGVVSGITSLGLSTDDVTLRQVGGESARLEAVASGSVAGTAVGAQLEDKIKEAGLNVLANLAQSHILYAQDYLVASDKFLDAHPGFVKKYRMGLEEARKFLEDPANEQATKAAFAKLFKVDPDSSVVKDAYNYTQQEKKDPYFFAPGLVVSKKVFDSTVKLTKIAGADKLKLSDLVAKGVPITNN